MKVFLSIGLFGMLVSSCSLSPPYVRPEMDIPAAYKEPISWTALEESATNKESDLWWEIYEDAILNDLHKKLAESNNSLQAAFARYQKSLALASAARADYFPQVTGNGDAQKIKDSRTVANPYIVSKYNDFSIGPTVSYEVDVWGRIRNQVAAAENRADASASDLAAMELSLHAELTTNYFAIRGIDEAQLILDETINVYKEALLLTRNRFTGGIVPETNVDQIDIQLRNAETMATNLRLQRTQLEHAIAVLIGESPSSFSLGIAHDKMKIVSVKPGIPSVLLECRPDIVAAEQRMQAANADIGVAKAAFFPAITLSGGMGFESKLISTLFQMPSLFWSIGPFLTLKLFDGGRIEAFLEQADANYCETLSNYRQTVLVAFQEVEDNLTAIYRLNQQMQTQSEAVNSSKRFLKHERYRFKGGISTYLDTVTAQNSVLQSELDDINIRVRRQIASVQLIKAIGGNCRHAFQ